jgi:outer membrane protein, heavy metal efflux system
MAMSDDRSRLIVREAGHAFADYVESTDRHRIHRAHLTIARHLLDLAEARHATGGSLADATKAMVELSRLEADVVRDATLVRSAQARINALLDREPGSLLGPPVAPDPALPAWDARTLMAKAHQQRPELKVAQSQQRADELALRAAKREATWPSFSLGALYFPATDVNPYQGYGASASMSLPWLWGGGGDRRAAQEQYLRAVTTNVEAARLPIDAEVVTAQTTAESAAYRLMVLRDRTLVATRRAFDVAQSGYESGRADLLMVLDARRSVVDVEHDIVMARSELAHALVDLDAAVGTFVPTKTLPVLDAHSPLPGADDVH